MGRGLSELQQFILKKAATLRIVYYADICMEYYGWKPRYAAYESHYSDGTLMSPGRQRFSRKEIGEREYSRVMATMNRSCNRRAYRGLVTGWKGKNAHWRGVKITDSGRRAAKPFS